MLDFQQKRKFKKVIYSRMTILALFVFVVFIAHSTYNIYNKERLSEANLSAVKNDYTDLDNRKKNLETEISKLQTEDGIEADIRDKFNVAKPGETVVVIVDNSTSTNESDQTVVGFWQRIAGWFR